jgi:hypothetical protein
MIVVEKMAQAIRFAKNPLDGDPIGVMIHTYDFLPTDGGLDAQIAEVDKVCAVMARAALTALHDSFADPVVRAAIQAALDEKES